MSRHARSLLSFIAGVAAIITVLVVSDLRQTVIAAVKATLVRDVDHAANHPFIGSLDTVGHTLAVPTTTLDGQPVKRLVIEFVTGSCNATLPTTVTSASIGVTLDLGGGSFQNAHYSFNPTTTFTGATNQLSGFSQSVRLYSDPGTQLTGGIGRANGAAGSCTMIVSGHLVTQ